MATKRMFALTIIDSDAFLDMPLSSQCLYFHLSMRADDDGFINNPKRIQKMIGAADDDLKLLIAKRFVIPFDSGIVVIKHWRINNNLRSDRYKETVYKDEKSQLTIKPNGAYKLMATNGIPNGNQMAPQISIGKDSIDKDRVVEDSIDADNSVDNFQLVWTEYQNNISINPSPFEFESIQKWYDTFKDYRVIIKAIHEAAASNARNLKYVEAILMSWDKLGIKTIEQVESHIKSRKASKDKPSKLPGNYTNQKRYSPDELRELEKKLLGRSIEDD